MRVLLIFFAIGAIVTAQPSDQAEDDAIRDDEAQVNLDEDARDLTSENVEDVDFTDEAQALDEDAREMSDEEDDDNKQETKEDAVDDEQDINERAARKRLYRNCRDLRAAGHRYSGIYAINLYYRRGRRVLRKRARVYCEMNVAGGPYTFLPGLAIRRYPTLLVNYIARRRHKVLLRFQGTDTTQPYTILQRLRSSERLSVQINSNRGYQSPQNRNPLQRTYIYLGFLNTRQARNRNVQGFRSNGSPLKFRNCDANPNSYFAFFPNHFERRPSNYGLPWHMFALTNNWINSARQLYSHSTMPNAFFFFTEMHFGGCGAYWQTNRRYTAGATGYARQIEGVAIGLA